MAGIGEVVCVCVCVCVCVEGAKYCVPMVCICRSYKRSASLGQFVMHRGLIISVMQVCTSMQTVALLVVQQVFYVYRPSFQPSSILSLLPCMKAS